MQNKINRWHIYSRVILMISTITLMYYAMKSLGLLSRKDHEISFQDNSIEDTVMKSYAEESLIKKIVTAMTNVVTMHLLPSLSEVNFYSHSPTNSSQLNTLTLEILGQRRFFDPECIIRNPTITVLNGDFSYSDYRYLVMYSCYKKLDQLPTVRGILCDSQDNIINKLKINETAIWPYYPTMLIDYNEGFILGIARSTLPTFLLNKYDIYGNLTQSYAFDDDPLVNGTQATLSIVNTGDYEYLVSCAKNNKLYTITNPGAFFPNQASVVKQIDFGRQITGQILSYSGSSYLAYYSLNEKTLYIQVFDCNAATGCNRMTLQSKYNYLSNSTYRVVSFQDLYNRESFISTSDITIWDYKALSLDAYVYSHLAEDSDANEYNQFVTFDTFGINAKIYGYEYLNDQYVSLLLGRFYLPAVDNVTVQPFSDSQLLSAERVMLTRVECYFENAGNSPCFIAAYYLSQSRLVAYFPFLDNANDQGVYANNAIVKGAFLCKDYLSQFGHAYCFNGTGSYLEVPNSPSLDAMRLGITIVAWVKPMILSGRQTILCKWDNKNLTASSYHFGFIDNKLNFEVATGDSSAPVIQFSSNNALSSHIWSQVAVVYNYEAFLYINGQRDYYASGSQELLPNNFNVLIGSSYCSGAPCDFYEGAISQIRIYNKQLSDADISELYDESGLITPSTILSPVTSPSANSSPNPNPSPSSSSNPNPASDSNPNLSEILIGCSGGIASILVVAGIFTCIKKNKNSTSRPSNPPLLNNAAETMPLSCRR